MRRSCRDEWVKEDGINQRRDPLLYWKKQGGNLNGGFAVAHAGKKIKRVKRLIRA